MTQISHVFPSRLSALAASAAMIGLLAALGGSADAAVKVVAPSSVEAPARVPFTASAADASQVTVLVDGKRRWAGVAADSEIRHSGALRLGAGSHRLEVRAVTKGVVERTSKVVHVTNPHSKKENSPASSPESPHSVGGSSSSGSAGSSVSTRPADGSPTTGSAPVETVPTPAESPLPVETTPLPVKTTPPAVETAPPPTAPTEPAPTLALPTFSGFQVSSFLNQSASGAISEVADPAGSGEKVFKMTVGDNDVYPITPTENPRAELVSPPMANNGTEFWATMKFFLPSSFPSSVPGWLTLLEGPYGPPFEGSPPWHLEVNGDNIQWVRNGTYGYDVPWSMPLTKNSWVNVMVHEKFGTEGWIEMWINGQPINFFAGGTYNPNHVAATNHLSMQTMDATTNGGGGNSIHLMNYRERGMFESVTVYEGGLKVGNSQAAVSA
jgi:Polysaccharide lyase